MHRLVLFLALIALMVASLATPGDEPRRDTPIVPNRAQKAKKEKTPAATTLSDDEALKKVGLPTDDAQPLLDYLKSRTLNDVDQNTIGELIQRFGADSFEERVQAMEDIQKFGPAAIGPLKSAERDLDPEVAYRAWLTLRKMEKVPHTQVAVAVTRTLVKLQSKDAAAALMAFLPMADSEEVVEVIRQALAELVLLNGEPDPAIVAALTDKSVVRRMAAYTALIEGGNPEERLRIPQAFPRVKEAIRQEANLEVKFHGLWTLLMVTREKEFLPDLLELIPQLPRGRLWQVEDYLDQVAGESKPTVRTGKTAESLNKARAAWQDWWKTHGDKIDLTKAPFTPRITGFIDVVEYDYRFGNCRVLILGPDMKEKIRFGGERSGAGLLSNVVDIKKTAKGHYLLVEMNNSRITERDSNGKILHTLNLPQPLSVDVAPDGGITVVCRHQVIQYDKDYKPKWTYNRNQYDIMTGRRLPNGDVVFLTNSPQGGNCFRLAAKDGKEVGQPKSLGGRIQTLHSMDASGDNTIVVCELNRVVEYDIRGEEEKAKELWKYDANNPSSCQRLPNGNTLIALQNQNRVIEVTATGEIVWDYQSEEGFRPSRAFVR